MRSDQPRDARESEYFLFCSFCSFLFFFVSFSLCSALFSFVSRANLGSFSSSFFSISSSSIFGVFKQKLKLMPPPLSLHKQPLALMNAQKVEQYHISSSHLHTKLLFVCACVRERERAKESKRERGVRLIKLFEMEENIRERDQRDRKNTTSPFLCESERERESFRGFSAAAAQREAFEMLLCLWSFFLPSERALRGKETVCAPKRGLFLSLV